MNQVPTPPFKITKVTGMKSMDSNDFVAIIIEYDFIKDIPGTIIISDKQITVHGTPIATQETVDTWKDNELATAIKVFNKEDIEKLFNDMNNEPFGKSMIELWGLNKELFIYEK